MIFESTCYVHISLKRGEGYLTGKKSVTVLHAHAEGIGKKASDTPVGTRYSKSLRSNTFSSSPGGVTKSWRAICILDP